MKAAPVLSRWEAEQWMLGRRLGPAASGWVPDPGVSTNWETQGMAYAPVSLPEFEDLAGSNIASLVPSS